MFTLRFDMRAPAGNTTGLYAAAIEMCAWAETRGAVAAVLSEHHATDDRHLPAPLILASAIAARTRQLAIMLAAVPITFWDPVRLAEEMSVLDIISGGRVSYAFGIGHRAEEYEHFGVGMADRGRVADETLTVLRQLLSGKPVHRDGSVSHVTPPPATPGGPLLLIAGGSRAAARRAARNGLGFISQTPSPELREFYEAECRAHGFEPGLFQLPVAGAPTAVFVADDIDTAWDEIGSYLLHDAMTAASYRHGDDSVASICRADSVPALRDQDSPYRIMSTDEAAETIRGGGLLPLLPLCGGLPPETAWPYLERAARAVERAHDTKLEA
ncbi:LLM class flavin-dependent oxidoreductase [Mycolicibacterium flavescens]|uniref:Luciferase n=1 Tax=Mycolicibacterium flavescens TaxID=1776 RepID=A0A1E3RR33_MYCFV|nr:LLM class flavin-dependent oxidoreductase [Mycolicibacterium flavescens]MCV7279663.1 LLM class flavin-dependent oxidoreductase [Mycolicibacterium flavescens]ODQ92310.1 luciferase [Mycolicibacterium flavescens]